MRETIKPLFRFKPNTVTHTFTTLSKVDIDLPGSIDGRRLAYTSTVDGVVHLVGQSQTDLGESSVELFVPFQKSPGGYHIPAYDYADRSTKAEQGVDGKPPEAPQPPR